MKSLIFFKKDINSCSRCGLCQAVCPVYQITKNDCTSPRGKFILINEMLKNNLKPTQNLKNYMTMCINCGKCTHYCPSKIDIRKINEAFFRDFPHLKIHIKGIPFLIRYFFNLIFKGLKKNIIIPSDKKIIYLAEFGEKEIPEKIKNFDYTVIECGIPLKFALSNPNLYKELTKNSALKINNNCILLTKSPICKTEIQFGLNIIKKKQKIHYIN